MQDCQFLNFFQKVPDEIFFNGWILIPALLDWTKQKRNLQLSKNRIVNTFALFHDETFGNLSSKCFNMHIHDHHLFHHFAIPVIFKLHLIDATCILLYINMIRENKVAHIRFYLSRPLL